MLTPPKTVHLSGPLHQPRNLLYRYGRQQIRHRRVWVASCTFGEKRAQNSGVVGFSLIPLGTNFGRGSIPRRAQDTRLEHRDVLPARGTPRLLITLVTFPA